VNRRALAIFAVLFAVYAATLGLDAFGDSNYGGDEPHYLLAAQSIVHDRDVDLRDDYRARAYADFYPYPLDVHGVLTKGRLHEPHGVGFPLLIAPAYALGEWIDGARGGAVAVELLLAAIAALAGALAYLLALRVAPDPWAGGAALAVGLSPPLVAYGSAVYPELTAACALAGAACCAASLHERISRRATFGCFALLGLLPWLGTKFVPAGIVIGAFALRSILGANRRVLALGGFEVAIFSVALYVGVNQGLYGGLTPYAADDPGETATDADGIGGYLERAYRLGALFIDRDYGLLRWAPLFALALFGVWLLWRSRREGLRRLAPDQEGVERVALMCALALGAQLLVAAFLAPTMFGFWFPGRHLVAALPLAVPLVAWGLRHAPRAGSALALIGLIASVWLYVDVRWGGGGLVIGVPDAPWGPLERAFPFFGSGPYAYVLVAALIGGLALVVFLSDRHSRQSAGTTRAKYSG